MQFFRFVEGTQSPDQVFLGRQQVAQPRECFNTLLIQLNRFVKFLCVRMLLFYRLMVFGQLEMRFGVVVGVDQSRIEFSLSSFM